MRDRPEYILRTLVLVLGSAACSGGLPALANVGYSRGDYEGGVAPKHTLISGKNALPVSVPRTISTLAVLQGSAYAFGVARDVAGNIYFSDFVGNTVQKIDTLGNTTVIAGTGLAGFSGDGGPSATA